MASSLDGGTLLKLSMTCRKTVKLIVENVNKHLINDGGGLRAITVCLNRFGDQTPTCHTCGDANRSLGANDGQCCRPALYLLIGDRFIIKDVEQIYSTIRVTRGGNPIVAE